MPRIVLLLLACFACLAAGPITITTGGVYTGDWQSDDSSVPAVHVITTQPVTIENATIRSKGTLIDVAPHSDVTVRNVVGTGLISDRPDRFVGRFLDCRLFHRIVIEHCTLEHTSGIYLHEYAGDHSPTQTFKIRYNSAHNIDGRFGDGRGGYRPEVYLVQFFQINDVNDLAGGEIAWNEINNDPGQSAVEDNVNIFKSSGTPASPFDIHDNYIRGAYPADPKSPTYSGGGIMLSDTGSAFSIAHHNQVIDTSNYGIAISSGHDNCFYENRIVSSGRFPDGSAVPTQNVGAYIWNMDKSPDFARNTGHDNLIGFYKPSGSADAWTPDAPAGGWKNNKHLPDLGPTEMHAAELKIWREKLAKAGVHCGAEPK